MALAMGDYVGIQVYYALNKYLLYLTRYALIEPFNYKIIMHTELPKSHPLHLGNRKRSKKLDLLVLSHWSVEKKVMH